MQFSQDTFHRSLCCTWLRQVEQAQQFSDMQPRFHAALVSGLQKSLFFVNIPTRQFSKATFAILSIEDMSPMDQKIQKIMNTFFTAISHRLGYPLLTIKCLGIYSPFRKAQVQETMYVFTLTRSKVQITIVH